MEKTLRELETEKQSVQDSIDSLHRTKQEVLDSKHRIESQIRDTEKRRDELVALTSDMEAIYREISDKVAQKTKDLNNKISELSRLSLESAERFQQQKEEIEKERKLLESEKEKSAFDFENLKVALRDSIFRWQESVDKLNSEIKNQANSIIERM
jgi:chaperonin cofactor prefoldin